MSLGFKRMKMFSILHFIKFRKIITHVQFTYINVQFQEEKNPPKYNFKNIINMLSIRKKVGMLPQMDFCWRIVLMCYAK